MKNLKQYSSNWEDIRTETPFTFPKDTFATTSITRLCSGYQLTAKVDFLGNLFILRLLEFTQNSRLSQAQ